MNGQSSSWVLCYSIFVACPIQAHPQFYEIASEFFDTRNVLQFEQKYPRLNQTRVNICPNCPASTDYNEGMGIDCWFDVPLPLGEEVYQYIYNTLHDQIRPIMRDLSESLNLDNVLGDIQVSDRAALGGVQNGWLAGSPLLKEKVELSTPYNAFHLSVASVLGYIVRDGAMLVHSGFLARLFNPNYMKGLSSDSPLFRFSAAFMSAASIKKPIRSQIIRL